MHFTTLLGTWLAWAHLPSFTQDGWLRTLTLAGQHQNLVDQVGQSPLQTWVSAPSQATLSLAQGGHMHLLLGKVKSRFSHFLSYEKWKWKFVRAIVEIVFPGMEGNPPLKWWIFNITTVEATRRFAKEENWALSSWWQNQWRHWWESNGNGRLFVKNILKLENGWDLKTSLTMSGVFSFFSSAIFIIASFALFRCFSVKSLVSSCVIMIKKPAGITWHSHKSTFCLCR